MLKLKLQYFDHLIWRVDSWRDPDAGKDWGQEEKGVTEDEMVGWYHWLNGHEFEQTPGDSEGQGSLECCSPWGRNESDTVKQLNNEQQQISYLKETKILFSYLSILSTSVNLQIWSYDSKELNYFFSQWWASIVIFAFWNVLWAIPFVTFHLEFMVSVALGTVKG